MLPSKVTSGGMSLQYCMRGGRPFDQKLFAGYIRGVRVTGSLGAIWIHPGKDLWAYLDLRVVLWLSVAGLGLTQEAARLVGQLP